MTSTDLNLFFDDGLPKRRTTKVSKTILTEDCGTSLHFDRFNQTNLQKELLLYLLLLQMPSFFLLDVVAKPSGFLTQLIAGLVVAIFASCTCT